MARKVTEKIVEAFLSEKCLGVGNTVSAKNALLLHGHEIVKRTDFGYTLSLCGWNTPTTRERLNHFLNKIGSDWGYTTKLGQAKLVNYKKGLTANIDDFATNDFSLDGNLSVTTEPLERM